MPEVKRDRYQVVGVPLHPVFMYQRYVREYLKQRNAKASASEAGTK